MIVDRPFTDFTKKIHNYLFLLKAIVSLIKLLQDDILEDNIQNIFI